MADISAENERKIFDAIQDLKDSIFGLKQSYTSFCYDHFNSDGYSTYDLSQEKMLLFIEKLCDTARNVKYYHEDYDAVLPSFFAMTILFLTAACNPSDWLFVSIKKIGSTVYKSGSEKSVFDIMVEDSTGTINGRYEDDCFWVEYRKFNKSIENVDLTDFEQCVKRTLERFIDDNNLNTLNDPLATNNIIARLNRTSSFINRELQRNSRS